MKDIIKKILYIVTAFVITGVALFNSFSVSVMASTEVESLPRTDIDVEVSYNSDNVFLNYDGYIYTLPMNQLLYGVDEAHPSSWIYGYNMDGSGTPLFASSNYGGFPYYTNTDKSGAIVPCSFWFSPSENRVYVFSGHLTSKGNFNGLIVSFYDGSFVYDGTGYIGINYYDLSDMSFNILGLLSLNGNSDKYLSITPKMWTNSKGVSSWYKDETDTKCYYPSDLICVYSTYEISGFFEFDGSNIYTPDYYFDNQYLFYVEDIGYTFIDSAESLVDIIARSDGYVYLDFVDSCNRRVWTSADGVSWSYSNSVQAMYGDELQISYQWFYDNVGGSMIAKLVYTTDNEYGVEPILPPEFLEEYFSSEVFDVEQIIYLLDYSVNYPKGEVPEADKNWFDVLVYATQSFKGDIVSFYRYYQSLQDDSLVKEFTNFIEQQTILKSFTEDYVFEYVFHDDGTYTPIHKVSLYGFVKLMNKSLVNIDTDLNNIQLNLHNDLKSVFDNISLSNYYLESIDSALGSLPDYTKKLDKILLAIENLEITGSGGVVDLSSLEQYLIAIDDTSDIQELLLELDKSIANIAQIEAVDELTDFFDFVDGEGDEAENKLSNLFKDVLDPENQALIDDVGGFISGAVTSVTYGKLLSGAFEELSNSSDGIGWVNAKVEGMYAVSGNLQPIFLIGVSMLCVNLVVRRNG